MASSSSRKPSDETRSWISELALLVGGERVEVGVAEALGDLGGAAAAVAAAAAKSPAAYVLEASGMSR